MAKKISVLGSTGSIGTQTLDVVSHLPQIQVQGLTANENIDLLEKQILRFRPKLAAVMSEEKAEQLKNRMKGKSFVKILSGMEGLMEVAVLEEIDTVVTSVVGNVGLKPTFAAMEAGKNIALANKETLVSAGALAMKTAEKNGVFIYPVDSEHSAIFQCLQGNHQNAVKRILLTASGGPFRGKKKEELKTVTAADALRHPNWNMGKKITIDSATLMNKGLEVMEAKWLFHVDVGQIEVLIHPQSIIHSAVEFADNAVIAQLGEPDMRIPIQYALTYPERIANDYPSIDFAKRNTLTFEKPDLEAFPCLALAYRAMEIGGTMPAVLNGANEVAVSRFLNGEISFLHIPMLIESAMNAYTVKYEYDLEDLLQADRWAKEFTANLMTE